MSAEAVPGPPVPLMGANRAEWDEWDVHLRSSNPLDFPGYSPPAGAAESVRTGLVTAPGGAYVLIDCDFSRAGGTMGVVAGEKVARAYQKATRLGLPVGQIVSTGGARLQEGFYALVQMGRTVSAQLAHMRAGLISASVLTSPTTGGVFASWGSGTALRAATRDAVIGFGGPRVVHAVTGTWPPASSHTGESAYEHGLVDALIDVGQEIVWLEAALGLRTADRLQTRIDLGTTPRPDAHTSAWDAVLACREPSWPTGIDWASWLTDDWVEILGSGSAIRAGLGTITGSRTVIIAFGRDLQHGTSAQLPRPADFRLAQRAIELAGTLGLPLLTIVDTPGADPSPTSEAAGLALEISKTLAAMSAVETVTVSLCVGEGGSGGAMALAHTDRFYMLEGSVFEVIGPEAGATVLFRDPTRAPEMASSMAIRAQDLLSAGLCDGVLALDVDRVRQSIAAALSDTAAAGRRDHRLNELTARSLTTS